MNTNLASGATKSEPVASGATTEQTVNGQEGQNQSSQEGQAEPTKSVRFEDHKRALDDIAKLKREAETLRAQAEEARRAKLAEQGKIQEVAEAYRTDAEKAKAEKDQLWKAVVDREKENALREAALKIGIRQEALSDLRLYGLDNVGVEYTTDGRFIVNGADLAAESLKKSRPYLFRNAEVPNFNSGGQGTRPPKEQELTPELLAELSVSNKAKYLELLPKYIAQKNKRA